MSRFRVGRCLRKREHEFNYVQEEPRWAGETLWLVLIGSVYGALLLMAIEGWIK